MVSEKLIKRRIKSAGNIAQITKAMQMVAASKMKKAQNLALSGRPYTEKIAEMVSQFVAKIDPNKHPLLKSNTQGKTLLVLITTNKGLCGGLNTNLFRHLHNWFVPDQLASFVYVTIGKKGENFLVKQGRQLIADFSNQISFSASIAPLTTLITENYLKGDYKEVYLVYNNFISALNQIPTLKKILPITDFNLTRKEDDNFKKNVESKRELEFKIEPSIDAILDTLLFHYLENQIRDAVLEAEASWHSATMIAMKNATDNAGELIDILILEYNKARQAKITYEISDMVTARLAVEN
jgi:F-type H+-transporting ATPase subunit gamma